MKCLEACDNFVYGTRNPRAGVFRRARRTTAFRPGGGASPHFPARIEQAHSEPGRKDRRAAAGPQPARGCADSRPARCSTKKPRRIIRDVDIAFEAARGATSGELGKLRLGVGMSTVHSLVPRALLKFRESSPGVEIEIADMSTLRQIEALIAGRLDVGFVRLPVKHPLVAVRKVLTERLTIATSEKFAGPLTMKGHSGAAFHSHRSRSLRHLSRSLHQPVRPLRIHSENCLRSRTTCLPS